MTDEDRLRGLWGAATDVTWEARRQHDDGCTLLDDELSLDQCLALEGSDAWLRQRAEIADGLADVWSKAAQAWRDVLAALDGGERPPSS
jgi:hypothetical protein